MIGRNLEVYFRLGGRRLVQSRRLRSAVRLALVSGLSGGCRWSCSGGRALSGGGGFRRRRTSPCPFKGLPWPSAAAASGAESVLLPGAASNLDNSLHCHREDPQSIYIQLYRKNRRRQKFADLETLHERLENRKQLFYVVQVVLKWAELFQ